VARQHITYIDLIHPVEQWHRSIRLCGFELVTLFLAHPLIGYQIDITMSSGA
jgi:hypothetical protein